MHDTHQKPKDRLLSLKRHWWRMRDQRQKRKTDSLIKDSNIKHAVIRVPAFNGDFEVNLQNPLCRNLLGGQFESELAKMVQEVLNPNRDVIDVGANIGIYSVLCASLVASDRRVLSIEPIPQMIDLLKLNLLRNHANNVIIFEGAAHERSGTAEIFTIDGSEEYASLSTIAHPDAAQEQQFKIEVKTEKIDELVRKNHFEPGFVKIDVEGAEALALHGASQMLKNFRPVILSELDDRLLDGFNSSSKEVIQFLTDLNYDVVEAPSRRSIDLAKPFVGQVLALPRTTDFS